MVNPHALAAASGLPGYGPPRATNGNGFGPAINQTNGSLSTVRISKYLAATRNNYGSEDTRADAVLKHMTQVPNMSSVRYQAGQYIPDCTDKVSISPGIDACIQDMQEEHGEIRRLTVVLTSRKKTVAQITEFIEECDRAHQLEMSNKLANQLCVFEQVDVIPGNGRGLPLGMKPRPPPHLTFSKNAFVTNRTLGNVFFEQRKNLQQRLDFFQGRKDWYDLKGQPYMLGLLLHGLPGTGKTSTIKVRNYMSGSRSGIRSVMCRRYFAGYSEHDPAAHHHGQSREHQDQAPAEGPVP